MRIHDLINEIQELKNTTPRKAAFDIYNILENNKSLFQEKLDNDVFQQLLNAFENMAYAGAAEFNSAQYKDDFLKSYNLLSFYLNKVI